MKDEMDVSGLFPELSPLKSEEPKELSTYELWLGWFRTRCGHYFEPERQDVWNAAIETAAHYVVNEIILRINSSIHPDKWAEMRDKLIKDLKIKGF